MPIGYKKDGSYSGNVFQKGSIPTNKGKKGWTNNGSFKKNHKVSLDCRKKISLANKNRKKPPCSEEHKKKLSEIQKGRHYSLKTEFKIGHKVSEMTRRKQSEIRIGKYTKENNPAWKGGITSLNLKIRHSFKTRQWISDIFTRDNFTCQECAKRGKKLVAHHIKKFSDIIKNNKIKTMEDALNCEELWNINNGITLCQICHKKYHKIYGHIDVSKK